MSFQKRPGAIISYPTDTWTREFDSNILRLNSAKHTVEKPARLMFLQLSILPCRSREWWCAPAGLAAGKLRQEEDLRPDSSVNPVKTRPNEQFV